MAKMTHIGRPKIEIDPAEVEKLAAFGCPNEEIGTLLGCSENTIRRRFGEQTAKGRASLKKSLRRKQVEVALSGNATMLIWTGKNLLGQSDKNEVGTITLDVSQLNDEQLARLAKGDDLRSIIATAGASGDRAAQAKQDGIE